MLRRRSTEQKGQARAAARARASTRPSQGRHADGGLGRRRGGRPAPQEGPRSRPRLSVTPSSWPQQTHETNPTTRSLRRGAGARRRQQDALRTASRTWAAQADGAAPPSASPPRSCARECGALRAQRLRLERAAEEARQAARTAARATSSDATPMPRGDGARAQSRRRAPRPSAGDARPRRSPSCERVELSEQLEWAAPASCRAAPSSAKPAAPHNLGRCSPARAHAHRALQTFAQGGAINPARAGTAAGHSCGARAVAAAQRCPPRRPRRSTTTSPASTTTGSPRPAAQMLSGSRWRAAPTAEMARDRAQIGASATAVHARRRRGAALRRRRLP